ncbi:TonB-dependent hemoglobin/transferrin/lactoferrin family receptor [Novosphingobium sp. 9]|uniref:TonB-dependent hemoglobin/transferrin/lactoferrin family receptor n=1 Tax=Novosphingobium sp. 9 TaxID=2025349 RepID=UPI0021B5F67B|nr:TonB-dependent hemoglobin/transferrin/lactoferrin family receptor [Novosphingobium sp. 9]
MLRNDFAGRAQRHVAFSGAVRSSVALLALTSALGLAHAAYAQQQDDSGSVQLGTLSVDGQQESVVVAGNGFEQLGKPEVLTTKTDLKTLQRLQTDSVEDYTRRIDAGVTVNGNNGSFAIRGLDADRVQTTVDGVRLPWLSDGARGVEGGSMAFDFDGLVGIDVVKSADSSVFGTGAFGGVVALRTLDPEDLLTDGKTQGGLSRVTYDSASDSIIMNQSVALRHGNTMLLVQGGYRNGEETKNKGDVGGTGATRTDKNPANYDQGSLLVKLRQYLPGGHRLGLEGELFSRNYDEDTLTSVGSTYSAYTTQEKTGRKRLSGTWDYTSEGDSLIEDAHLLGYWQRATLETYTMADRLTAPVGEYDRDSTLRQTTFGGKGSVTARIATGAITQHVSLAGELYGTRTHQYATGSDTCASNPSACTYYHINQSDMPDVSGTDLGVILQDRIVVGEEGRLRVTPGIRFDYYKRTPHDTAAYQANDSYEGLPAGSSDSHWSPKILAEYDVLPKLTVYGQWSEAFRAPSATELYLSYGGSGTYVSVGDPDLKPETSKGWEAGVKYGDGERGLKVSYYDNRYRNFIDTITTTAAAAGLDGNYPWGVYLYVNRQHVRIRGVEAEAHWAFSKAWRVWGSFAYADGKDTDEDVHLNSVAPIKGVLGVGYTGDGFGADLTGTAAGKRDKVETPTSDLNKTPSYQVVDLSAWWQPWFAKPVRITAGVYNLFNETWYNALDIPDNGSVQQGYYSQPGRTFKASVIVNY